MPRPVYRCCLSASVVALATLASARPAAASDPCTTYVVPSLVEMLPTEATATRVVIHGAFFHLTTATAMTYSDPKCGVMYFQCVAGQETMCRMQWNELRAAVQPTTSNCSGFGNHQMVSTATMYVEGQPLGAPDPWDLGMGIGIGSSVDGKCPLARQLSCPPSGSGRGGSGGSTGAGGSTGGAGGSTAGAGGSTGGAGGSTGGAGAAGGRAGAPGTGGTAGADATAGAGGAGATTGGAPGMGGAGSGGGGRGGGSGGVQGAAGAAGGEKPPTKPSGGCAITGAAMPAGPAAIFVVLGAGALVTAVRARRRR